MTIRTDPSPKGGAVATDTIPHKDAGVHERSVTCSGLRKIFSNGDRPALDDVDLHVPGGRITVLLGPSGCGKTTLLRSITGLENPDSGEIRIGEKDVTSVGAEDRGVAMVFQNYALYPNKTVRGNIEFPLRMLRVEKQQRSQRATEIADMLRLGSLMDRKPAQLSGGQRQRVGIGRALVRDPDVLLMDEPFSNLDAELRVDMRSELLALQRKLGTTIVFVTHDQVEALSLADQLVVMRAGRIEQKGDPEAVFEEPSTEFVATFLCEMNVVPAKGPLHDEQRADAPAVGFRPESIRLGPGTGDDIQIIGQVRMSELHGRDRIVHLDMLDRSIRMRVPSSERPSGSIPVHVRRSDLRYFDADGTCLG
ncbi:ABC transporter ATP-binding protein [Streptomyces sp. NPDC004752]